MSSRKVDKSTLVEIVLLPAALLLLGYVILWSVDGTWWGVALWVVLAPVVYFAAQFLLLGRGRAAPSGSKRARVVAAPGRNTAGPGRGEGASKPAQARWTDQQDVSAGAEILRRGRRYDRRA
ncbi:MAG: hypothetical protein AB1689_11340 [Thermodesulfobacteriota bacterium]